MFHTPKKQREKFRVLAADIAVKEFNANADTKTLDFFPDELLTKAIYLINEFSELELSAFAVSIRNVLQDLGRYAGDSISSNQLAELFRELIGEVSSNTIVYDGCAGYANISSNINGAMLHLEEINAITWQLSKALLLLQDRQIDYRLANSLINPGFIKENNKADIAVMTPPLGMRLSAEERTSLSDEKHIAVKVGKIVPTSAGDVIWIQKALSNVNDNGKVIMLLPQGWLFRGGV